jgi:ABC-type branched-subunit amino acid transport system ATPase component/branched-subunit amino acid ABC-type transport system permease component
MLPFIVIGLVTGAIYGLAGVGLVLTYKMSGVFNFAHGALATVSAYLFYTLHVQHGVPWPIAAAIAVFVISPVLALVFERLARSISGAGLAVQVAAMVGVALVIQAAVVLIYGLVQTRIVPVFLSPGQAKIFGTFVQWSQVETFGIALLATVALYAFFRIARLGVAMRAVVDDPALLDLSGTSPRRVRRVGWLIGVAFAAGSGVLLASVLPLDPVQLTLLVVEAFGAAALGAFTSLPVTFVGGLAIGVLASLCTKWFTTGVLAGVPPAVPFIVLFVAVLVFPRRYLVEGARVVPRTRSSWTVPAPLQWTGAAALLILLLFVPSFAGIHLADWTTMLGTCILFLSLGLLVRVSGQVSLSHVAFAAIGATALGHLALGQHLPWLLALLCAGLIAVPVGALLAVPAMRLTGLYLALATFGFSVALTYTFYTQNFMFGDTGSGISVPLPHLGALGSGNGYYYLLLGIAVAATAFVIALTRSRLGRLLRGMADSPTALATCGTSINTTRLLVFCLSAFMAAIAGALIGAGQQTVTETSYAPLLSLTYLALIIIMPGREPWYAIGAATGLIIIPSYLTGANTPYWLQLLFGVAAILFALTPSARRGLPPSVRDALDRHLRRTRSDAQPSWRPVSGEPAADMEKIAAGALEVRELTVRFGGLVAVDGLSLTAPTGRITGLIGPNGAGKTTTFNACCGLVRPWRGRIALDEEDLTHRGPATRARRGIGRTFQRMELFDSLTVWENVMIGREAAQAGGNPFAQFRARRSEKQVMRAATAQALELCDLTTIADRPVGDLSTGQRRLVELARCLAGPFRILLLDEPSSGLDHAETRRFGEILGRVARERGVGILLVEHDMSLVMDVCEHIYVLDFGRLLFEGGPEEIVNAPIVRAAYLGDEVVELPAGPAQATAIAEGI